MIFDLTKQEGVWFDFPGGGKVKLKTLTADDYLKISKEVTENKPFLVDEPGKLPRVLNHEIVDTNKQSILINDTTILAWEGFYDVNEKEIPCTSENKTLLMRLNNPAFRDFVNAKLKALDEAARIAKEDVEKNS